MGPVHAVGRGAAARRASHSLLLWVSHPGQTDCVGITHSASWATPISRQRFLGIAPFSELHARCTIARGGWAMVDRRRVLLGARIRELRAERGLSQERLAEAMQANVTYLSSIERGRENPTLDFLIKLSDALRVDLVDLVNFSWLGMNERDLRKQLKGGIDALDIDRLRELLAMMKARQL